MQFIKLTASLAAAILAYGAAADTEWNKNSTGAGVDNRALVVNNCPYKVYLWSILKGQGCPSEEGVLLQPNGGFYHEAYRTDATTGVSLKISKSDQCKGVDITQLEYFEERASAQYASNYFDVSYVDCESGDQDCCGRKDGYYLKSGNVGKITKADASNTICPTYHCTDKDSCDKTSYVLPDDVQTKSCGLDEPLEFYLCGQNASGGSYDEEPESSAAPSSAPSSTVAPVYSEEPSEEPTPSASSSAVGYEAKVNVADAQITSAPAAKANNALHIKTETVYVTEVVKRHAHAQHHARRHFRA